MIEIAALQLDPTVYPGDDYNIQIEDATINIEPRQCLFTCL